MIESPYMCGRIQPSLYLRFLEKDLEEQWRSGIFHPKLYVVVDTAALWHFQQFKIPALVTSLWREWTGTGTKIHRAFRGCDLRSKHIETLAPAWEEYLNKTFPYLGKEGCTTAWLHDVGQGVHLHLQIGPLEPVPEIPASYSL